VDDDCDGTIDEGVDTAKCRCTDADGLGSSILEVWGSAGDGVGGWRNDAERAITKMITVTATLMMAHSYKMLVIVKTALRPQSLQKQMAAQVRPAAMVWMTIVTVLSMKVLTQQNADALTRMDWVLPSWRCGIGRRRYRGMEKQYRNMQLQR